MMSFRRLCGYDFNGWRDQTARNWRIRPDGEIEEGPVYLTPAILDASLVRTGAAGREEWIGGAQAGLSPHGLGEGWGSIGDPQRRRRVRDCLADSDCKPDLLAAALRGLTFGASTIAVSLEEHEGRNEGLQDRLLRAAAAARLGQTVLVWRSVLTLLGHLQDQASTLDLKDADRIGVICQDAAGFSVQSLRLWARNTPDGLTFIPERRKSARHLPSRCGYEGLLLEASRSVSRIATDLRLNIPDNLRNLTKFALSGVAQDELLRDARGGFHRIRTPEHFNVPPIGINRDDLKELADCRLVLFESRCSETVHREIYTSLANLTPVALHAVSAGTVARGAFEAARRLSASEPVYYDFLPQISTIVLNQTGASSLDLIETDARLPAGRIYRSPVAARFGLQRGAKELKIYLKKEHEERPRLARHDLGHPIETQTEVALHIEQAPAAGRARLIVEAPGPGRQFRLDWESAEPCQESWDELIERLSVPPVSIPRRMVLQGGIAPWQRTPTSDGLTLALRYGARAAAPDWGGLSGLMSRRVDGFQAISSDGELPPTLPPEAVDDLSLVNARAMAEVRARAEGKLQADNNALKFLTWQFRRAPSGLARLMLDVMQLRQTNGAHPFIRSAMSWILIAQGLGRICSDPEDEKELIRLCMSRPVNEWSWRIETAAMAFLFSRSPTAHRFLTKNDLQQLIRRIEIEFRDENGGDYTRFNYAPLLLAGLLRQRERDLFAFVVDRDPLAQKLDNLIEATLKDFDRTEHSSPRRLRNMARYHPLLEGLRLELRGEGNDPDILLHILNVADAEA